MPKGNLVYCFSESFCKLFISVEKNAVGAKTNQVETNSHIYICMYTDALSPWNNRYQPL